MKFLFYTLAIALLSLLVSCTADEKLTTERLVIRFDGDLSEPPLSSCGYYFERSNGDLLKPQQMNDFLQSQVGNECEVTYFVTDYKYECELIPESDLIHVEFFIFN